jgi:HEAT repeat protein
MKVLFCSKSILLATVFLFTLGITETFAQTDVEGYDARANTAELGRQLGHRDPLVRQRAAEALARLAATDQKKLIEGYYLVEKNKEVRLALTWASYRIGKEEALYQIVRELDSGRHDQAVGYLGQLDTPSLLYPFLRRADNASRINSGLIEALARIGDRETLELIRPFRDSFQRGVAEAAEKASDAIQARLGESTATQPTRPRTIGKDQPPE